MTVLHCDCVEGMRGFPDDSFDSIVTDPPYGLSFMGEHWDYDVPGAEVWREVLRVLKPGGHLLAFAGTRTQHRMAVAIEDAGFDIRDMIAWVYGSGFPKSLNLEGGRGTALKPALETITMARKPLIGTVAGNVAAYGVGVLNIDACRVGKGGKKWETPRGGIWRSDPSATAKLIDSPLGRWPANLIHDGSDEVTALFPAAVGRIAKAAQDSAARFFYCAKARRADREEGNTHPTVKPTELMRYLCRLVTPPGGVILDPFAGSGSTGKAAALEGFQFIGFEREAEYVAIANARIEAAKCA